MDIAKIFDQTIPYVSGYTMRSRYISESLAALGNNVRAFTSPLFAYDNQQETIGGVEYIRTPQDRWNCGNAPPLVREFKTSSLPIPEPLRMQRNVCAP